MSFGSGVFMFFAACGEDLFCRFGGPPTLATLPPLVMGRTEWPRGISAENDSFELLDSPSVVVLLHFSTLTEDETSTLLLVFRRWKGSPSPWCSPRDGGGMLMATAPAASISLCNGSSCCNGRIMVTAV